MHLNDLKESGEEVGLELVSLFQVAMERLSKKIDWIYQVTGVY